MNLIERENDTRVAINSDNWSAKQNSIKLGNLRSVYMQITDLFWLKKTLLIYFGNFPLASKLINLALMQ